MKKNISELSPTEFIEAVEGNYAIFDEYFSMEYAKSLEKNLFDGINTHYFRSKFVGLDAADYPTRNNPDVPLIFISNHSGMAFPWDAMVLGSGLLKLCGHNLFEVARPLVAPMLLATNLMNTYLIPNFWRRASGISATALNFETMMYANKSNILIYPEGVPGIGKGFNNKYKLQQFSTSMVRMALKYKTNIIPISTVNAEYINPWAYKLDFIDRLSRKIGIPFLPLNPILLLIPLAPWLFYFGFPARLTFVRGTQIAVSDLTDKPYEELSEAEIRHIRDSCRASMQRDLDAAVAEYGQSPYEFVSLLKNNLKHWKRVMFFNPVLWVFLFWEHERHFRASGNKYTPMTLNLGSIARIFFQQLWAILLFVPILGLIPFAYWGYKNGRVGHLKVSQPK